MLLSLPEQQIDDPAAADVRARRAAMAQDVGAGGAGVRERVGEDGETAVIEMAARQLAFVVDRLGQLRDGAVVPGEPGGGDGGGVEGVAEDVANERDSVVQKAQSNVV